MSLVVVTRRVRSCCQLCASSAALMEVATSGTWSRHFRRAAMAPGTNTRRGSLRRLGQPQPSCLSPQLKGLTEERAWPLRKRLRAGQLE